MPVLITAFDADLDLVRPLASLLLQGGGEVRCYLEYEDHELRNMGCKIAVGSHEDDETLAAALTNVHTFLVFAPDQLSFRPDEATQLRGFFKAASMAVKQAPVDQVIVVASGVEMADDPIASAMAQGPSHFSDVAPLCILLCSLIDREVQGPQNDSPFPAMVVTSQRLVQVVAAVDDRERTEGSWVLAGERADALRGDLSSPRLASLAKSSLSLVNSDFSVLDP